MLVVAWVVITDDFTSVAFKTTGAVEYSLRGLTSTLVVAYRAFYRWCAAVKDAVAIPVEDRVEM